MQWLLEFIFNLPPPPKELIISDSWLDTLFILHSLLQPQDCSAWLVFLRHASKLPWPDSPGHCLTSSICRGTILCSNLRSDTSILLSGRWTDLHLWRTLAEPSREALVSFPVCLPSALGPNKQGISQVTSRPTKISSIWQGFWGGLLRFEMLSRNNILRELFRSQATFLCIAVKALVEFRNNPLCQWLPTYSSENTAYPSPQPQKNV